MTNYNEILLEQLLLHIPCAVYWRDRQGRYLGCNQLFSQQVGLPIQDIIGKIDAQLPWGIQDYYQIDQDVMRTNTVIERIETRQSAQHTVTLRITRIPLMQQGRTVGILGIALDITETCQLREQAETASRLKLAFIRDMEHDIRTPLSGIWGTANMIVQQETNNEKKQQLHDIVNCSKELLNYCNDIINISKIETCHTPILAKTINLKKLIHSILQIETPIAKRKKINLTFNYADNLSTMAIGDPHRIKCILLNLVSNAIKFTQQGYVNINANCIRSDKQQRNIIIELSVTDSGIGLPADKRDWIFETFTKVDPSNTGYHNNHGFGLRIVKRLVDELDGDIHLKTELGKGSTFSVHLPLKIPLTDTVISDSEDALSINT